MSIGRKIFNRDYTVKQRPIVGDKRYQPNEVKIRKEKEEADICLHCTKSNCKGICDEFKLRRKRIWEKK